MLGAIRSMTKGWKNNRAISPPHASLTVLCGLLEHLERKKNNHSPDQLTFGMLCKFDLGVWRGERCKLRLQIVGSGLHSPSASFILECC
jgi:hypothetical protein